MRKATILLAILALALMTAPVLADCLPGCEVINGDFQSDGTSLTPWVRTHSSGTSDFSRQGSSSTNYYAETYVRDSKYAALGQVFYEPDWDPLMTHKEFTASVKMDTKSESEYGSPGAGTLITSFYYWAGSEAGDPMPTFSATNPTGWTLITSFTAVSPYDGYPDFGDDTYSLSGKLDCQPYWLAVGVVLQGTDNNNYGKFYGAVDDICFVGNCVDPVPVPPSALLLGSGLLALGVLRFRKSC